MVRAFSALSLAHTRKGNKKTTASSAAVVFLCLSKASAERAKRSAKHSLAVDTTLRYNEAMTERNTSHLFLLLLAVTVFVPFVSDASIGTQAYTETFDNFSIGNIDGQYGWVSSGGTGDINEITFVESVSGNSYKQNGFGSNQTSYTFTATSSNANRFSYYFRTDGEGTPAGNNDVATRMKIFLSDSGSFWINICHLDDDTRSVKITDTIIGNNQCTDGTGIINPNNWTLIDLNLDFENEEVSVRLDSGAWSDSVSISDMSGEYIEALQIDNTWSSDETFWYDSFGSGVSNSYFTEFDILTYDENRAISDPSCTADSNSSWSECGIHPAEYGIILRATNTSAVDNFKREIYFMDMDGNVHEPVQFYSSQTTFSAAGEYSYTDAFEFPNLNATSTYHLKVCTSDIFSNALVYIGEEFVSTCADMFIGNGHASSTFTTSLLYSGITDLNSSFDSWMDLECDDVGILDVKKGVQCALIWAFKPNGNTVAKLQTLKNQLLYVVPIGYGTHILGDLYDASQGTTTDIFTFNMPVYANGAFSETGTEVSLGGLMNGVGESALIDFFEYVLYALFALWVFRFVLSLKTKEEI
jgi:hypothetical protein